MKKKMETTGIIGVVHIYRGLNIRHLVQSTWCYLEHRDNESWALRNRGLPRCKAEHTLGAQACVRKKGCCVRIDDLRV